jgi:hypothetical protein
VKGDERRRSLEPRFGNQGWHCQAQGTFPLGASHTENSNFDSVRLDKQVEVVIVDAGSVRPREAIYLSGAGYRHGVNSSALT